MALVTADEFRAALRLGDAPEEVAEANRLYNYAVEAVERYAPGGSEAAKSEATIRLGSYLYDQPTSSRGDHYAAAGRNSGAWSILAPYRIRRAGTIGEAVQIARESGTPGNPVTNVQIVGGELVVSYADGTTDTHTLPDTSEDQTARDAAEAAQAVAENAQSTADGKIGDADADALIDAHTARHNAHHEPPHAGIVHVVGGKLPGAAVAFRMGWSQTQTINRSVFTRVDNHPTDGAAVGTTDGLAAPPFPPALNTDPTLYLHLWFEGDPDITAIRRDASASPVDITDSFTEQGHTGIDGVGGTVYVSNARLAPVTGTVYDVLIAGDEIATVPALEAHANDPDAHHSPGGGGSGASWHWFATFALTATTSAGTSANGTYRTGPFGPYADAAAVRAAITSNAIPQLIVFVEEIDSDGVDSDVVREVVPTSSGFGESGGSLNIFEAFTVGGSPKKLAINVGGATPTLTPDFTFTVTGQIALHVRVGVWA